MNRRSFFSRAAQLAGVVSLAMTVGLRSLKFIDSGMYRLKNSDYTVFLTKDSQCFYLEKDYKSGGHRWVKHEFPRNVAKNWKKVS